MNRLTVAALAALESLTVAAVGLGIALVPATLLWALQFHLSVEWPVFYRAAGDIWLIGHGVDLRVQPDAAVAAQLGLGQVAEFRLTIAALGFTLLAVVGGTRVGRRAEASGFRLTGVICAIGVYAVVAALVALTATSAGVGVPLVEGIALPAACFGVGVLLGAYALRSDPFASLDPAPKAIVGGALRAGATASAVVIGAAAVVVAVLLAVRFAAVVELYETLRAGVLGATVITLAQFALLPNAVVWAASWLIGPGFAVGGGSMVSPFATGTGPLPALPLLGILPDHAVPFGLVGVLIPLAAGVVGGILLKLRGIARGLGVGHLVALALATGVVAGVVLGVLAWWSSGAIGPGRLQDTGPDPFLVGAVAALEVAIGAGLGLAVVRSRE